MRSGSGIVSRQRTTSPYGRPALADDAATAAISNHGCSARSRTNFWPTVPVAPSMATGIFAVMRPLRASRSVASRT